MHFFDAIFVLYALLLEYADIIFDNCFKQEKLMIENLQYAALRLVTGAKKGTSRELLLKDCGLCTMQNRRTFHKSVKLFSIINNQGPSYPENCLPNLSGGEIESLDLKRLNILDFFIVHLNSFASRFYHLL